MNQSDLTIDDFMKYLKIYNADIDWRPHLEKLYKQTRAKSRDDGMAKLNSREAAAFAILYPAQDKYGLTDPPHKLLFFAQTHDALPSKQWLTELCKVIEKDHEIKLIREELISIGTVDPIFYVPRWRQAFNWLMDSVKDSGLDPSTQLSRNYETLVKYYGGTLVGSLFDKQYKKMLDKIPNWRTPYFAERMIHQIYNKKELMKIRTFDYLEVKGQDDSKVIETKVSMDRNHNSSAPEF